MDKMQADNWSNPEESAVKAEVAHSLFIGNGSGKAGLTRFAGRNSKEIGMNSCTDGHSIGMIIIPLP